MRGAWGACSFILFCVSAQAEVADLSERFAAGLAFEVPQFHWNIQPLDSSQDIRVNFKPNVLTAIGPTVSLYGIGLSYLSAGQYTSDSVKRYGKTSYDSIRLTLFPGKEDRIGIFPYYSRYKGFYVDNSSEVDGSISNSDPRLQRPDLEVVNIGFKSTYYFNSKHYSAAALFAQSAVQKDPAGSFFLTGFLDSQKIFSDPQVVPAVIQNRFGSDQTIRRGRFSNLGALAGYGYTLVFHGLFLHGELAAGWGYQRQRYELAGEKKDRHVITSPFGLAVGLGYNVESFYFGVTYTDDDVKSKTESLRITSGAEHVELVAIGRF